jgi:ankyrin repeat protein
MSESNNNTQTAEALLQELIAYCQSDSLSEEGLRERIERLMSPNISNQDILPHMSDALLLIVTCCDERVTGGIIQYLLECFPNAARKPAAQGQLPLHMACCNKNVTLKTVRLLIDAAPDSVRSADTDGRMPLHYLCHNNKVDEIAAIEILKLLIEMWPESVRQAVCTDLLSFAVC